MNKTDNLRQIVVLSGKGGTGKTSLTASFAKLLTNKIVIDCDVDAANLYLLLNPRDTSETEFISGYKAEIDPAACSHCGGCAKACRFEAIKNFNIDPISCEGCGLCIRVCPSGAIRLIPNSAGVIHRGIMNDDTPFYYARLFPGQGNSGKLVSEIKRLASESAGISAKWLLVDGPPGIGCPVNASLAGADYVVLVAEPTLSGLHDLERIIELLKMFKYSFGIIINKSDINKALSAKITELAHRNYAAVLGEIRFNPDFVRSLQQGKTIIEYSEEIRKQIIEIWERIDIQSSAGNIQGK